MTSGEDWREFRVVDAFTRRPFSGNPAAVVLPDRESELDAEAMQAIAAEINLSETAFPSAPNDEGVRTLRWFTPTTEVTLCGHATLATAHVLFEGGAPSALRFLSASGELTVHREAGSSEADGHLLRLDFPADPPLPGPPPPGLMTALGCFEETPFAAGARCGVVELSGVEDVRTLRPDLGALRRVPLPVGMLGVSVTAAVRDPTPESPHFVSRFFGPWVGVDEDPVTGMAHCVLGPHWAARLGDTLRARQLSAREGTLEVRMRGDRVHLVGEAVTMARGTIRIR
ncbi:MAG: PhzF family phenazine biosynthesis protein [Gemmatimonadales bacterium]|nr:MAG: PhzF family phenazine biosynthesis protein [Gemmatimonadales bacterium]